MSKKKQSNEWWTNQVVGLAWLLAISPAFNFVALPSQRTTVFAILVLWALFMVVVLLMWACLWYALDQRLFNYLFVWGMARGLHKPTRAILADPWVPAKSRLQSRQRYMYRMQRYTFVYPTMVFFVLLIFNLAYGVPFI